MFTNRGLGFATQQFINKVKNDSAEVIPLIYEIQIDSFAKYQIKYLSCLPTTIYSSPVYAFQTLEELDSAQVQSHKIILRFIPSTSGYAVRLRTGIRHTALTVFEDEIKWNMKILLVNEKIFPKICMLK